MKCVEVLVLHFPGSVEYLVENLLILWHLICIYIVFRSPFHDAGLSISLDGVAVVTNDNVLLYCSIISVYFHERTFSTLKINNAGKLKALWSF